MDSPLIKIKDLRVSYDGVVALEDVNLTILRNDFLGIIGPNGGGKTTLIKALLGLVTADKGSIEFFGSDGAAGGEVKIGYLPQYSSFDFSFPMTVRDVVMTGLLGGRGLFHRFTKDEKNRAQETMRLFEIDALSERGIGELSGGQRQRVLMARALVSRPQLLILDEPSTYIDKESEGKMYDILREVNKQCAIVLVSHDVGTIVQEVRNVACVNHTLHYHPAEESAHEWFEHEVGCPLELVTHGHLPHRVLGHH